MCDLLKLNLFELSYIDEDILMRVICSISMPAPAS